MAVNRSELVAIATQLFPSFRMVGLSIEQAIAQAIPAAHQLLRQADTYLSSLEGALPAINPAALAPPPPKQAPSDLSHPPTT